jgi:hypothetical protein
LQNLFSISAAFIVSLGGGGVIVFGLANWIGQILAERYVEKLKHEIEQEIQSYKTKLKKSEFLFQKEFEAASQFLSLRRRLLPRYHFREMEGENVCQEFALTFGQVEKELEGYMTVYGAALNRKALDRLSEAIEQTAAGKFEVSEGNVTEKGYDIADKVMKEPEGIENELHEAVRSQSST